jgi:hypothetical protein
MGVGLGYKFNKSRIKNGTYAPVAHGRIENEQERLRQMCLELLEGTRILPMYVTNLPPKEPGSHS